MSLRDETDILAGFDFVRNGLTRSRVVPFEESFRGLYVRRAVVVIVVVALVGAGTFGLGYFLGRRVRPRSSGTQSASPTTVVVPKVLHLALTGAVQQVLDARLAVGKVGTRTGGKPGTIVAQFPPAGTSTRPGSPVDPFVSTSLYPKGAFEQCPAVAGTLPLGPDAALLR
jgi:hypothetical protein